jgi:hypothetical protein
MKRPPRGITSRMECLIETTLAPGRFVSYHVTFSFLVEDLRAGRAWDEGRDQR